MDQNDSTHRALVVDSGSGVCKAVFASFPRAVFLPVVFRPQMLVIMAGMDQKEAVRGAVQQTADFPQLQFIAGRRFPCRGAEAVSHGPDCDAPVMQAVRVPLVVIIPVAAQTLTSIVLLTMEIPQLLFDEVVDVLLCRWWCEFHRCRRGKDSCAPTVAPVEKLVFAALEFGLVFFKALCTGTGPGAVFHRDTAPIIRCIYWRARRNSCVKSSVRTTTTTTTTPHHTPPLPPSLTNSR